MIRSSLHERERTMQVLLDAVGNLAEEQPHGALAKSLGATLVSKLTTLTQGEPNWSDPPEGFFEAAWPAYIEAVQEGDYFYSSEEVLAVAHGAEQNVVVTKTEHEAYLVVGQTSGFDGPQAIVALQRGGGGRVRTHFERLLPEATLQRWREGRGKRKRPVGPRQQPNRQRAKAPPAPTASPPAPPPPPPWGGTPNEPHVEDTNVRGKSPAPSCQQYGQQRRRRQTGKSTLRLVSRPSCCAGGCEDEQVEGARCPAKRHAQEVNADETQGLQSSESESEPPLHRRFRARFCWSVG